MNDEHADVLHEYGPFLDVERIHGVGFDGVQVWIACGGRLSAVDSDSGELTRSLAVPADAGTAFDGTCLYQIAGSVIRKLDPASGELLGTIPAPGRGDDSGLAWAEGSLWVGQHRGRCIHQVDPATGRVLRTIDSERFVTGVTWVDGELWHGTWEKPCSDLRCIDPATGVVKQRLAMAPGVGVSGLTADGGDRFFCGGGGDGRLRVVRGPRR